VDIGDAFLSSDPRIDEHLRIVISDPGVDPEHVVLVGLTSYDRFQHEIYKDNSCLLNPGDHPWITHQTCVSYRDGTLVSEAVLNAAIAGGKLIPQEPISDDVLTRILEGAERTDELPNKCRVILEQQRLIDL
jgi:hypothetical protein